MRFKTRLKPEKVPEFLRITSVLERLDGKCILHLPPPSVDSLRIVVQADVHGSVASYTIFKRSEWFESYRIESQNENQIGLQLQMHNLIRALRSASAADDILIKLAKKGVPVLAFEISTPLGPILQDIPVTVLSAARLAEYEQPDNEYVRGFALPSLQSLHSLVDRMKSLSTTLHLKAQFINDKASLFLSVRTDNVTVSTKHTGLSLASYDEEGAESAAMQSESTGGMEAVVDLKNFSKSLYGHQVEPTHAICFIHANCVMVHLIVPSEVGITYYLPRRVSS